MKCLIPIPFSLSPPTRQGQEQQQGDLLQHRLRELGVGGLLLHAHTRPGVPAGGTG